MEEVKTAKLKVGIKSLVCWTSQDYRDYSGESNV
jgi:hypothetical protein